MKVSELLLTHQKLSIGAPFDSTGRLLESEHIEMYMTQKTERAAQVHFCRTKPCLLSWTTVSAKPILNSNKASADITGVSELKTDS